MKTLVIKESQWLRLNKTSRGNSFLRREGDGKKCCLGFACMALGITGITDQATPANLVLDFKLVKIDGAEVKSKAQLAERLGWLISTGKYNYLNSSDCYALIETNDNVNLSDQEKKAKIRKIFAKHKVRVVFSK